MNETENWIDETIEKIQKKMQYVSEKNRDKIPYTTDEKGDYDDRSDKDKSWTLDDGLNWWTNGFWSGIQWLLYQKTGEKQYRDIAQMAEKKLKQTFTDYYGLHHDVGFMFQPSAVANYRLTGNEDARKTALHAANLLAGRFNPAGRFIRAWNDSTEHDTRGWAIIDCMFNISLLYWASEETGDPRYREIAMLHADTVRGNFVRPDGSVCHIVEFNPETGKMVKSLGGQGYGEGSSWTRGQGWALYGFMISYLHTSKQEYLDTAKNVAEYCLKNIPASGIIPVDFRQPAEPDYEDSCGACVIAGGLLELARVCGEVGQKYQEAAELILSSIAAERADWTLECDAIVKNCSGSYHDARHHFSMVYADYYFIEAIYKLREIGSFMW